MLFFIFLNSHAITWNPLFGHKFIHRSTCNSQKRFILFVNDSIGEIEKEYSSHVTAMKFIG